MRNLTCVIIDDDEIDRLMTVAMVKNHTNYNIVGIYESATLALPHIQEKNIDILFLDIDMPELNGLEFRKMALNIPVCIFISAHPEQAVESFSLDTLDFIVKPIKTNRFLQTCARINEYCTIKNKANLYDVNFGTDKLIIKEGKSEIKINIQDIIYLEALKDYTKIVTSVKKHCVLTSIGNLLKQNEFTQFIRVHKSFAVHPNMIVQKTTNEIEVINHEKLPIGRSYKENIAL